MFVEYDKEEILRLKEGGEHHVNLGEESGAEIWLKNDIYFLFEIPQYGGRPNYSGAYTRFNIGDMINEIKSWT